jgi:hypothetical protein
MKMGKVVVVRMEGKATILDSQNEQVEKKIQRMNALLVEATVKDKTAE